MSALKNKVFLFFLPCFLFDFSAKNSLAASLSHCDVVIVEASLGGVAAALQSARLGARTCLTSMTDWVGGQVSTQGISAIDGPYHYFFSGADREFLTRYGKPAGDQWFVEPNEYLGGGIYSNRPHTDEVERTLRSFISKIKDRANCWVSLECFRPSDADRALKELLQPYIDQGVLQVFYETVPKRVHQVNGKIQSIDFVQRHYTGDGEKPYAVRLSQEFDDWYSETPSKRYIKDSLQLSGNLFIDGTETGEIIALSGARHRLGFEGDGVTPPDPECVMGFTFSLNLLAKKPDEQDLTRIAGITAPEGHEPFDIHQGGKFKFWFDDPIEVPFNLSVFDYRRVSNDPAISLMNWSDGGNDFSTLNLILPSAQLVYQLEDWKGGIRTEALAQSEDLSYAFVNWLNQQPSVTWGNRGVVPLWDLSAPENYFGTGTGLAKFPYLRETRRLEGYQGFTVKAEEVTSVQAPLGEWEGPEYSHYWDSIGIGAYPVDIRSCPGGKKLQFGKRFSNHYQIPLRAMISSNVRNLMVANKTGSVSQIANAAYRLHPTEWNAGFGVGTAAAVANRHGINAHQLMTHPEYVKEVQTEIIRGGNRVLWFSDRTPQFDF